MPGRLEFLDGLRGFAALVVIAHHYSAAFYPTSMTGMANTAHLPGRWETWFAGSPVHVLLNFRVCFFFVLSGLVLAASTAHAPRGWRTLLAQLVRRYVRLGLPVAISVAMGYALLRVHGFYNEQAAAATGAAWFGSFWRVVPAPAQWACDMLFGVMVQGEALYNPVLWTMMVEWFGSLLVLGLLAFAGGLSWRLALYAALALGITLSRLDFYYVGFLLGLGLFDIYRQGWVARLAARPRRGLIAGLLLVAFFTTSHPQVYYAAPMHAAYVWLALPGVGAGRTVDIYHTLGAAALLAAVLLSGRLRQLTMAPWLRRVGRRAFALYLTHFLVLGTVSAWLFLWLRGFFSYHASFGLMLVSSGLVLAGSAELFYQWVDRPSHAAARWLGRWVGAKLASAAAPTAVPGPASRAEY
ncbi:acyltransferase family protein [Hymenobacter sp. BRD67]|uniref:acyltransferase family protein n=1 Tax=Hymenobacter sp. BRD67 TaxID=2675877 RepID=UPI0015633D17|nr:acyltransferase [Hymenobacter sp. BRD67]QKG51979.1 acyltransferase [Hymenobacter sp. BRD67]